MRLSETPCYTELITFANSAIFGLCSPWVRSVGANLARCLENSSFKTVMTWVTFLAYGTVRRGRSVRTFCADETSTTLSCLSHAGHIQRITVETRMARHPIWCALGAIEAWSTEFGLFSFNQTVLTSIKFACCSRRTIIACGAT